MKLKSIALTLAACTSFHAFAITEYNTDLVIVGSGVAGLTAAAYAEENGVDTIVLEKLATPGGQLYLIEGTYAVETPLQKREMVGLTKEKSFQETMDYAGWKANPALVKRIIDDSDGNIKWMMDRGIKMGGLITDTPDGNRTYHTYHDHNPGAQTVEVLTKIISDNGGQIFTETPGTKLVTNGKGEVTGIWADSADEGEIKINAKAVLMATGSISHNKELLVKYNPELLIAGAEPMKSNALKSNTGDGIIMGQAVGADLANLDMVISEALVPTNTDYKEIYTSDVMLDAYMMMKAHSLWVNTHGDRVMDESLAGDFTVVLNVLKNFGNQGVVIMDDAKRKDMMQGSGSDTNYFTLYDTGRKVVNFDKVIKDGQKRGYAFKANSIRELAKQLQIDPATLQASVDRYNTLAKEGADTDMGKDAQYLSSLLTPPFYALKGDTTICDMGGGLKINHKSQVMHLKGNAIKGLYAAGATAGGMYGDNYPYIDPGFASAAAIATGRFAVQDVAEKFLNKTLD
ncbi:FAD-binding protein [Ferrimonas sp. SCSIO 43195]|uniref:FAD-dependent oxidoreductase n=1 Tax=Ferrimonas sp. SCSIO 43195 TaxID=2822844 RepID=UPI002074FA73|nr:FAD-binding protein [Ferrimonas sp. SCSIO 43195]USD37535.1 FAD-binding protein [Ferrimonas sp. SCSIO 43195]